MAMGMSSCSLDMLPLNDVVLENFWTDKADVESVVASCYQATREGNYISNIIVWGECRSDNVDIGPNIPDALKSMMQGSLKTTNYYCDWSSMYNVINRCNTVLHYAPQVAEKDPNYTPSDLNITIAECSFLRAYSYLTLIKTFKNVPFSFEPSIEDSEDFRVPQTSFENILDALIGDIEVCKDYAPRKYSNSAFNTGKVTRAAMYSLLAELYLWRASDYNLSAYQKGEYYRRCISACDWVINYKRQQYYEEETYRKNVEPKSWNIGYPLLSETLSSGDFRGAFYSNFINCGSFESIFEIPFKYGSTENNNGAVADMYGYRSGVAEVRYLRASQQLMSSPPANTSYSDDVLFPAKTDYRSYFSFGYNEVLEFPIRKYVVEETPLSGTYGGSVSLREGGKHTESWIIYRLPEIMLFRAEAEIELAALLDASAMPTFSEQNIYHDGLTLVGDASELYLDAYNLITAVYNRSNPSASSSDVPKQFRNLEAIEKYLMSERQREFLFEGKRYYDLVRQARREGNTNKFSAAISSKFTTGAPGSLQLKMKMMDFMYMPILKSQMQVNPQLVQNPAYADEEETVKN